MPPAGARLRLGDEESLRRKVPPAGCAELRYAWSQEAEGKHCAIAPVLRVRVLRGVGVERLGYVEQRLHLNRVQPLAARITSRERAALRGVVDAELVAAVRHPHDVAHPGQAAIDLVAAEPAGGEADEPSGRRVEDRVMAASLPVSTEQGPFFGVELRPEQLGIAADVAVELGERIGDVL